LLAAHQCTRTVMRRLPRLEWRFADVWSLLTRVSEPAASFGVSARLAPMEILIGGRVLLLLQSFERTRRPCGRQFYLANHQKVSGCLHEDG
jgi:hypothetical protein